MQGIRHGGAAATEVELRCSELGCDLWALILSAKDGGGQGGAHLALNRDDRLGVLVLLVAPDELLRVARN